MTEHAEHGDLRAGNARRERTALTRLALGTRCGRKVEPLEEPAQQSAGVGVVVEPPAAVVELVDVSVEGAVGAGVAAGA